MNLSNPLGTDTLPLSKPNGTNTVRKVADKKKSKENAGDM